MGSYLLLLRGDNVDLERDGIDAEAHFQEFVEWSRKLQESGQLTGVERLDSDTGGVLRQREGQVVLDGPFTEARELVLGYFAVTAPSLEAAVEIARGCPALAVGGSVEVRAISDFPKP